MEEELFKVQSTLNQGVSWRQLGAALVMGSSAAVKTTLVVMRLREEIDAFKRFVPLLQEVANPALLPRHWQRIMELMEQPYDEDKPTSLQNLVDWGIEEKMEGLENIGAAASKEYSAPADAEQDDGRMGWHGVQMHALQGIRHLHPWRLRGGAGSSGRPDCQGSGHVRIAVCQTVRAGRETGRRCSTCCKTCWTTGSRFSPRGCTWEPIFSSEDIVKQMPEEG